MIPTSEETLPRIDELLMRVLDGEASPSERSELLALADADSRLAPLVQLRERLRSAVLAEVGEPEEVVGEVFAALALDDGWDSTAADLREAFAQSESPAIADGVMAAILAEPEPDPAARLSALFDGELAVEARLALAQRLSTDREAHQVLAEYAEIGRMVREATVHLAGPHFDGVWPGVARDIGLDDPEYVPGWEPMARAVREAVAARATLSPAESSRLTGAILNALPRPEPAAARVEAPALPWWRTLLRSPIFGVGLVAAAVLVAVGLPKSPEVPVEPQPVAAVIAPSEDLVIGEFNQAEVESLEVAPDVMVQVVQLEDGAPVLLMIDEDAMAEGATL